MMKYRPTYSRFWRKKGRIVLTYGFILVLIGIMLLIFPRFLASTFHILTRPLWQSERYLSDAVSKFFAPFRFKMALIGENESLKNEIEMLRAEYASTEAIFRANDELRSNFANPPESNSILAG